MSATNTPTAPAQCLRARFCEQSGETAPGSVVAAGWECAAFRLWIDDLPEEGHYALMQLRGCGFSYDLIELETQLSRALQEGPAGPLARIVGQRVLDLLAAHHDAACFLLEEEGER
jgi:hypothetical protein